MTGTGSTATGAGGLNIRPARHEDLEAIQLIYAEHVQHGRASFEEVPPTLSEMQSRFAAIIGAGLPWLVAEADGHVLGYAYAGPYRARSAYRFTLEHSVYVDTNAVGHGTGYRLLEALIQISRDLGYLQMLAVIGDSGNTASIALHLKSGFRHVGTFENVGLKFGEWLDTVLMQLDLTDD